MADSTLSVDDQAFLEEWKHRWLKGSFLTYNTRGSEPIKNIDGKINRARQWGIQPLEMRSLLDQVFSEACRPDQFRYEKIRQLLQQ